MLALLFTIGAQRCGVDARWVVEVVPAVPLEEPLARYPNSCGGLVRRGAHLPVYDLEQIFAGRPSVASLSRRIIIVPQSLGAGAAAAGLMASGVTEATRVDESSLLRQSFDVLRQDNPAGGFFYFDVNAALAHCGFPAD